MEKSMELYKNIKPSKVKALILKIDNVAKLNMLQIPTDIVKAWIVQIDEHIQEDRFSYEDAERALKEYITKDSYGSFKYSTFYEIAVLIDRKRRDGILSLDSQRGKDLLYE